MAGMLTHEQQLAFGVHTRGWRLVEAAREIGYSAPLVA
jgi:hypothetical protein